MSAYLIRRLWQMVPTLAGVVLLVFGLFKAFGGDPAEVLAGLNASPEQIAAIRRVLASRRKKGRKKLTVSDEKSFKHK